MTTPKYIIVTDTPEHISEDPNRLVIKTHDFILKNGKNGFLKKDTRIINLAGQYKYLSRGYYVSLLAEARGNFCIPDVSNIIALNWRRNYEYSFPELNAILEKTYDVPFEEPLTRTYTGFFGRHENPKVEPVMRRIFDLFRMPVSKLEITYAKTGKWKVTQLEAGSFNALNPEQLQVFNNDLDKFTGSAWRSGKKSQTPERHWIAILYNPEEALPPSNAAALKKFVTVGKKMGLWVELITKYDFSSLLEFDALFIRETTAVNNHTYRFAQKAEQEGIPSVDDTASIIKCCNKVYLNELLETHNIPRPATMIMEKRKFETLLDKVVFPSVLKIPDGSFSRDVYKVSNSEELKEKAALLFKKSEIILCQEFVPSTFDWRIGIMNQEPLFAIKYFMAKNHWQIYNHAAKNKTQQSGMAEAVPLENVPADVTNAALKAANLIGKSLYGVDLKQLEDGRVVVIEVNDNPNIDHGVEDLILGDSLYQKVLMHIVKKIDEA